jgi:hypothetical protein
MKYAVEMGSFVTIVVYKTRFIKIFSGVQKLVKRDSETQKALRPHKSNFIFLNKHSIRKNCKKSQAEPCMEVSCMLFLTD